MPRSLRANSVLSRAARLPLEALESRQMMSVAPAGIESVPVEWNGQTLHARPGSWVVGVAEVGGNRREQVERVNRHLTDANTRLRAHEQLGRDGVFRIEAPRNATAAEVRQDALKVKGFRFVEPDFVLTADATTPDDGLYAANQWGLNNAGQTGGTVDADIDAPEAWDAARGGANVVVGVIDSGVDYLHPDLAPNIWKNPGETAGNGVDDDANGYVDDVHGWDFANADNQPLDDNGHGTHVAGTIAAAGNNGRGVTGVNWTASVVPMKFMNAAGSGYLSDAVAALNYATTLRSKGVNIRVTNNSWGGGGYSSAMADAIRRNSDAGILFVAAAGNSNTNNDATASYPSNYDTANVVAVAATDANDARAGFSSYGATTVDLAAPGVDIFSTTVGGNYGWSSGTSMAAPHVAGAAALAWSYAGDATVGDVKSALLNGADRVASLNGVVATGGRLNAAGTLRQLGFRVTGTTPAAGASLTTAPTQFVVNFSTPVAAASLQAGDFTVNGAAATSVAADDADTVTFTYATSPATATGTYTMQIAAGAVTNTAGAALTAWGGTFQYTAPVAAPAPTPAPAPAPTPTPAPTPVPSAPSRLVAKSVSSSQINLTWRDHSANETGFKIESSTNGSTFTQIGTVAANSTGVTVSGLSASRTYYFRVRATNAGGDSAYSNTASATTRAAATRTTTAAATAVANTLFSDQLVTLAESEDAVSVL